MIVARPGRDQARRRMLNVHEWEKMLGSTVLRKALGNPSLIGKTYRFEVLGPILGFIGVLNR